MDGIETTSPIPRKGLFYLEKDSISMIISVLSFISTSFLGYMTFSLQNTSKTFEATGNIETDYLGDKLHAYCGGETTRQEFAPTEDDENLYQLDNGFVQNDVWKQAKSILKTLCNEDGDYSKSIEYVIIYFELKSTTSIFTISPEVQVESIRRNNISPIWKYNELTGKSEWVSVGPLAKDIVMRIPVAISVNKIPISPYISVPRKIRWKSPVNGQTTEINLSFIVNGRQWRSLSAYRTGSGYGT